MKYNKTEERKSTKKKQNILYRFTSHLLSYDFVIHRQTVSFYQNSSVWLDKQDARSRDRNPSNFALDYVSDHSSTKRTTLIFIYHLLSLDYYLSLW